jgi:putative ABC transport system substrate-binding protein
MMKSKTTVFFIAGLILLCSCGQKQPDSQIHIGLVQFASNVFLDQTRDGFVRALADSGYNSGKNIRLDLRNAQGDMGTLQLIMKKFLDDRVDLIVAISTPSLQAAFNATDCIPIIFGAIANPIRAGAGISAEQHLPNVTGASAPSPLIAGMELLKELLPNAKRVGTLWNPSEDNSTYDMERFCQAAREFNLEPVGISVSHSSEVYTAAQALVSKDIDAIVQILDNITSSAIETLIQVSLDHKVPLITFDPTYAKRGATVGFGWDYFANGYRSGELAIRVLKGVNPATIPFQGLTKTSLTLNLKSAELQNLRIPETLLKKADQIID